MAKKNNDSVLLFGLAVGIGVTVYALKQFTAVFDKVEEELKKRPLKDRINDFMADANKQYQKFSDQAREFTKTETAELDELMKTSSLVKNVKSAVKKATSKRTINKAKKAFNESAQAVTKKVQEIQEDIAKRVKSAGNKSKKTTKSTSQSTGKPTKTDSFLSKMEKGKQYTQRELATATKVPYRTVRRYVEELVRSGKMVQTGYGKGKRFGKK